MRLACRPFLLIRLLTFLQHRQHQTFKIVFARHFSRWSANAPHHISYQYSIAGLIRAWEAIVTNVNHIKVTGGNWKLLHLPDVAQILKSLLLLLAVWRNLASSIMQPWHCQAKHTPNKLSPKVVQRAHQGRIKSKLIENSQHPSSIIIHRSREVLMHEYMLQQWKTTRTKRLGLEGRQ